MGLASPGFQICLERSQIVKCSGLHLEHCRGTQWSRPVPVHSEIVNSLTPTFADGAIKCAVWCYDALRNLTTILVRSTDPRIGDKRSWCICPQLPSQLHSLHAGAMTLLPECREYSGRPRGLRATRTSDKERLPLNPDRSMFQCGVQVR